MFDVGSSSENPRAWFNEKEITHIDELHPEMAETFRKLISRDPPPSSIGAICERYRVEATRNSETPPVIIFYVDAFESCAR